MLRITVNDDSATQTWVLQGWLIGPWVAELKTNWETTIERRAGRKCLVDVSEVVCVDPAGELMLQRMLSEGAQVVACGVYTKQLLADLGRKCKRRA